MKTEFRATAPGSDEYAEYYIPYVTRVPDGDVVATLRTQQGEMARFLAGISPEQAMFSYAPGKWNIKEVIGHLTDGERVFAYRALRIARGDATPLPRFDENEYVKHGGFSARSMADLAAEFDHVRTATLDLFSHLDEQAWLRRGTASTFPVSVRALAWIIAGHERHHVGVIKERYLK